MDTLGIDEDTPIDQKILSNAVETAQKNVESRNFRPERMCWEYDDVMNTQREVIYAQRRKVLDGENLRENVLSMLRQLVESQVATEMAQSGIWASRPWRLCWVTLPPFTFPRTPCPPET